MLSERSVSQERKGLQPTDGPQWGAGKGKKGWKDWGVDPGTMSQGDVVVPVAVTLSASQVSHQSYEREVLDGLSTSSSNSVM